MIIVNPIVDILLISGLAAIATPLLGALVKVDKKFLGIPGALAYLILILYVFQEDVWLQEYIWMPFQGLSGTEMAFDGFSKFFIIVFSLLAIPAYLHSIDYMERDRNLTLYYTLVSTMMFGLIGLSMAKDLFTFFVFWEAMAISSYVLVGFRYHLDEPVEAAVKYLVMSGVASLLLLLGISLVYGLVGSLQIDVVILFVRQVVDTPAIYPMLLATTLFLIGFGVKAAYFPFWTWLPDAHPAAPSPVSALLSGIVIKAGIVGLARFALPFITVLSDILYAPLLVITLATITIANLMALMQSDIKRLLAYSSIANIGFIMIGYVGSVYGAGLVGLAAAFSHVLSHALGKGLAFLSVGAILYVVHTRDIVNLEGFGRRYPGVAIALMLALLSLGGMPPLPGFWSKWILILSAWDAGEYLLAFIGVFNSVLAIIYYLWLMQRIFFSEPRVEGDSEIPGYLLASLTILMFIMLVIGVYPELMYEYAFEAAKALSSAFP